MKRKGCALFLALAMILTLLPMTALAEESTAAAPIAAVMTDMPAGKDGEIMQRAVDNGLLKGSEGRVLPGAPLTRAQMAETITRAFGASEAGDLSSFTDVVGNGLYNELACAHKMGVLNGSGSKMNPRRSITRLEAFVIIARALKLAPAATMERSFGDGASVAAWAKGEINAMVNAGYVNGDGSNLNLDKTITRMQFAIVFDNVIKTYLKTAGTVSRVAEGNVMVNVPGVVLKNCTVKGDLIIGDGVGKGDFTLDHVTVTGRTIVRGGGANSFKIIGGSLQGVVVISKTAGGSVRVVTGEGASVQLIEIQDGKDAVVLEGSFGVIEVFSSTPVILKNAEVKTLTASGENTKLTVDKGSRVETVSVQEQASGATLTVAGSVKTVTTASSDTKLTAESGAKITSVAATKTASAPVITAEKGSAITRVKTEAANSVISGEGKIGKAEIKADGAKVNSIGTDVTVDKGVANTEAGGKPLAGGGSGTTTATGIKPTPPPSTGGDDGGSASYTVTFVPNGANINNMNPPAQSVVSGGKAEAPGGIGKGGSTFHGWFTTVDFQGTAWDFATNTVTGPTTLYAKWVAYTKENVDEIIRGGIFDVNGKMVMSAQDSTKYAQLSELDGSAVTVNITNGTVDVAKVYTDIITTLVAALQVNEAHIATLTIGKATAIDVTAGIQGTDIESIVKDSGLKGTNGDIAGSDKISVLGGQNTTATVKDVNGKEYAYTLTFVDNTPAP